MVNNNLCEGNEADMFVTAFAGILDLSNGKLKYINAGFLIFTFKFDFDMDDYNKFLKNRFITCCEQEYLSYKFKDKIKIINASHNPCLKENKDYYIFHYLGNFK